MAKTGATLGNNIKSRYSKVADKNRVMDTVSDLLHRIYIFHPKTKIFFFFPINPQTYKVKQDSSLYESNIVGIGDIVKSRIPRLREWSWEGLFMMDVFDPLNFTGTVLPPGAYVKMIQQIQEDGSPFHYINTSMNSAIQFIKQVNTLALIRNFEWEERGGEPNDIYYNITITEYRAITGAKTDLLPTGFL